MSEFTFDDSGKVRMPSAVELLAADVENSILVYTTGTADDGRPYYAYIAVKPSVFEEFHALTSAGKSLALGEYGAIIAAGFAAEAPPEIAREMREHYGFDENYLEKLQASVTQKAKQYFGKKEKDRIDGIVAMMRQKPTDGNVTT